MHMLTCALVTLTLTSPIPGNVIRGQGTEELEIVRAVAAFVRDSLPKGSLVLDVAAFDSRQPLTPAVADVIAQEMGATRARMADVHRCESASGKLRCTLSGHAAVLSFSGPTLRDGVARAYVSWTYQLTPSRVAGRWLGLVLSRRADGKWQVVRTFASGMS